MFENPTAIIIDDDKETVAIFSEYLKIIDVNLIGQGYNGKMAVELYQKQKPDVVFLDLKMPDYDGFYALKNIRSINPDAYVVVITAHVDKDKELVLECLKPSKIIVKPFDMDEIVNIVKEIKSQN
ncbi:MAG: response regulator [Thaumarchaeota archaeon]|nr:response regulator [Nitrososphaerota archaeon]